MRLFAAFFAMGFRRWSTYRLAAAAGAFTNTLFGLTRAAIMTAAVTAADGTLAGYDLVTSATYAWLAQALIAPVSIFTWNELALRIKDGDIAVDLARPVDPQFAYLAADLGRAAFVTLPRGAPPLIVGALVTGLALPADAVSYLLGAASVVLAVCVSFACRWLINLVAFWLIELRGALTLYLVTSGVLSGHVVPVHWFPDWLATVAAWTPFPSIIQTPIDVLMGHLTGSDAVRALVVQTGWAVALLVAGRWVFARGTRKLVVQGG